MAESRIVFSSDFNCPFCFALNERVLAMGESSKLDWRGIEHMPAAKSDKANLVDQTQLINEVAVVRKRAPEIAISTPSFRPNTRPANRLMGALQGASRHQLSELRVRIYRAYWQDGRDIGDAEVLARLCDEVQLACPDLEDVAAEVDERLAAWQTEWESERFHCRLPAMVSVQYDKPVLGFPTFDLLSNFFSGDDIGISPESLATCELKPRQGLLLVGQSVNLRCNTLELEAAYQVTQQADVGAAQQWLGAQNCLPDMIVIDTCGIAEEALALCSRLRSHSLHRQTAIILLLEQPDVALELNCFDAGATDVLFDLSDAKVCQARLDLHLRMRRSAALLASLARMDYLTELPNRRECDRKLEEEWLRLRRLKADMAVVMIDIDHFKNYNDHYGHSMGDDCLRQVAKAMAACLRRPVDLLARYGGEEFIAILPETSAAGARSVAQSMVDAVRAVKIPHCLSSAAEVVTISAGVACLVPGEGVAPRAITEQADQALYRAKSEGRNRVGS
ncbi:MAG TPA: diguanylate cyclase [Motiliproteus sp.]